MHHRVHAVENAAPDHNAQYVDQQIHKRRALAVDVRPQRRQQHRHSRADGDAHVRLGQSRGVVDAVADHDDLPARRLFPADEVGLILRQNLGVELIHAYLPGHGLRGLAVIPGHHDYLADAAGVQRFNGSLGFLPQGIRNADLRCQTADNAQIQVRIFLRQGIEFFLLTLRNHAALILKNEVSAADDDLSVLHRAGDPVGHTYST